MSESDVRHIGLDGTAVALSAIGPAAAGVRLTARRYVWFRDHSPDDDLVQFEIELWTPEARLVSHGECMVRILRDLERELQKIVAGDAEESSFATEEGALTLGLFARPGGLLVSATVSHPYHWDRAAAEALLARGLRAAPVRLESAFMVQTADVEDAVHRLGELFGVLPGCSNCR